MTLVYSASFDAGNSHDDTGNGNDGVDTGMSYGTSGAVIGKAAQFSGSGGAKINFGPLASLTHWSIEGWIYATANPGGGVSTGIIGSAADATGIRWTGDSTPANGRLHLTQIGGFGASFDFPGSSFLTYNTKYQFAVTCDGTDLNFYINGGLDRTGAGWAFAIVLGRLGNDGVNPDFAGALDEINIWNRALSGTEIATIYNGGAGLSPHDPSFPDALPPLPPPVTVSPYGRMLRALFPPGRAFDLEIGSTISETTEALAVELQRVEDRGDDLMNEVDPRTADETLDDWDRTLGLPDVEVPVIPSDAPTHRVAITAKYTARGGQNYAFFAAVVAACGYTLASIEAFSGEQATCDGTCDEVLYGVTYAYAFQLNINAPTGDHVDHATLEAIVRAKTHSHVVPIFNYL